MKISGTLPKDEANGLTTIARQLVEQPHRVHAILLLVDCKSTKFDHDTGGREATARIRRAEAVLTVDLKLPFELEADVSSAFDGIDPITGEIFDPIDLDNLGAPRPDSDAGDDSATEG